MSWSITDMLRIDKQRKVEEEKQRKVTRKPNKKKTEFQRRREKVMEEMRKKREEKSKPSTSGTAKVVSRKGFKKKKKAIQQEPQRTVQKQNGAVRVQLGWKGEKAGQQSDESQEEVNLDDVPWEERAAFKARRKAKAEKQADDNDPKKLVGGYSSEERSTPATRRVRDYSVSPSPTKKPTTAEKTTQENEPPLTPPDEEKEEPLDEERKTAQRSSRPASAIPTLPPIPEEPEPNTSQSTMDLSGVTATGAKDQTTEPSNLTSINLVSPSPGRIIRGRSSSQEPMSSPGHNPNANLTPQSVLDDGISQSSRHPSEPRVLEGEMDIDDQSPAFSRQSRKQKDPKLPKLSVATDGRGITIESNPVVDLLEDDDDSDDDEERISITPHGSKLSFTPGNRSDHERSVSRSTTPRTSWANYRKRSWRVASSSPSLSEYTSNHEFDELAASRLLPLSLSTEELLPRKRPRTVTAGQLKQIFQNGHARFSHFERADLERPPPPKKRHASLKDFAGNLVPVRRQIRDRNTGKLRNVIDLTEFRMKPKAEAPKRRFINTGGGTSRLVGAMRSDAH